MEPVLVFVALFLSAVLGHSVADFLLQPNAMALGKSAKGWKGHFWCTLHCLIYTAMVLLFMWITSTVFELGAGALVLSPLMLGLIFLSHWPIDRWSLGGKWLRSIKGRDFIADYGNPDLKYKEIHLAFDCIVYTVADNLMHLALIWFILMFLIIL